MFYFSQSECRCVCFLSKEKEDKLLSMYSYQFNIENTSFQIPHNLLFHVDITANSRAKHIWHRNIFYNSCCYFVCSCSVTDERRQLVPGVGGFHWHGSLKQQSSCINYCHSITLGDSFMHVSNIYFGNSLLAFYKFGDRCFVKRNVWYHSKGISASLNSSDYTK